MVPTSALGLLLFVVSLAPGLAYVLRYERAMPAKEHSAFRESVRVLFTSIVCLGVTIAAASAVCWRASGIRPDVQAFLTDPAAYVRENFASAAWWTVAVVLTATVLGFTAADPRLLDRLARLRASRFGVALLGKASISEVSGWYKAIVEHGPKAEEGQDDPEVFVGALMDDGSYVRGYLVSHSTRVVDNGDRDLVITLAEVDTPEGETKIVGQRSRSSQLVTSGAWTSRTSFPRSPLPVPNSLPSELTPRQSKPGQPSAPTTLRPLRLAGHTP